MMSTAQSIDPATHCPACAAPIPAVEDRFCAVCGRQLLRPDLRARHINHPDWRPPSPVSQSSPPPAVPELSLQDQLAGPQQPMPARARGHGLAAALGGALVLALLVLSAVVILAVTSSDAPTPKVDNGAASTVTTTPVSP